MDVLHAIADRPGVLRPFQFLRLSLRTVSVTPATRLVANLPAGEKSLLVVFVMIKRRMRERLRTPVRFTTHSVMPNMGVFRVLIVPTATG